MDGSAGERSRSRLVTVGRMVPDGPEHRIVVAFVLTEMSPTRHLIVTGGWDVGFMGANSEPSRDGMANQWLASDLLSRVFHAVGATPWSGLGFQAEPGGPTAATRMLASVLVLAYSRGVVGSDEIAEACRNVPELEYLCSGDVPEPRVLRRFRRHHTPALVEGLARFWTGSVDGISPLAMERARRCLEMAVAADSLAMDF